MTAGTTIAPWGPEFRYPAQVASHRVEASQLVRTDPERAFDQLIAMPLPTIFVNRYAAFPSIREVCDGPEVWGEVGQTRTIVLGDGKTLRETMTSLDRPNSFGYVLDELTGPLRPFVRTVQGRWTVTAEGEGARITWAERSIRWHPPRA